MSLFTPEADLRCVNWIKLLLMPQSLIWYKSPKIVTKFTRGKILSFFNIGYNMTHTLGSLARWPIAFQSRIMCKYCFCLKSGAVLALNLLKKRLFCQHTLIFLKYITHYNCAMAAILMTSLLGSDAEFRWANWLKLLKYPKVKFYKGSPKIVTKFTRDHFFGPFNIDYILCSVISKQLNTAQLNF